MIQRTSRSELNQLLFHKTLVVNLEFMSPFPCVSILSKLIHLFLYSCCFTFHFRLFILVVVATILMLWSWKFCTRPVLPCKVCKQNLLSSYTKNCSLSTHIHSKIWLPMWRFEFGNRNNTYFCLVLYHITKNLII